MSLIVVGTNHKYSPVEIREKVYFSRKKLDGYLKNLTRYSDISSVIILSTCNRVEIYADSPESESGARVLKEFLASAHPVVERHLYVYTGKEALKHLFSVASGLDSQLLGEDQILEQVICAWRRSRKAGCTNEFLDSAFKRAIETSYKVKANTGISRGPLSIGSIIVNLIKARRDSISDKKILIIGVGKISESVAAHLKREGAATVFISNRTYERAAELAGYIGAEAVRFDLLKEKLKSADVVISATASPHFVLKKDDLKDLRKPLLIVDLAVPRDVEPEAKSIKNVELYCIDDLGFIIDRDTLERQKELPEALKIIDEEAENLCALENLESEAEVALSR